MQSVVDFINGDMGEFLGNLPTKPVGHNPNIDTAAAVRGIIRAGFLDEQGALALPGKRKEFDALVTDIKRERLNDAGLGRFNIDDRAKIQRAIDQIAGKVWNMAMPEAEPEGLDL